MEFEPKPTATAPELKPTKAPGDGASYSEFFPRQFDFYGLGKVELSAKSCLAAECASAPMIVAFQVSGDELGLCAVAVESAPASDDDRSLVLELANILASKFITQLADAGCADISISPPGLLTTGEPKHRLIASTLLAAGSRDAFARRYVFLGEGLAPTLVLRLAFLPSRQGGLS